MFKKILATLVLLTGMAAAQAVGAYGGTVQYPNGAFVPSATVRVCNAPASGNPCGNLATIFTDATSNVSQSSVIVLTPQNFGQYQFGAAAGNYILQISGVGLNSYTIPVQFGAITLTNGSVTTLALALNAVTQTNFVQPTGDFSTASTSYVVITGLQTTLTTVGGDVILQFAIPASATTQNCQIAAEMDLGAPSAVLLVLQSGSPTTASPGLLKYTAPASGSHTWNIVGKCAAGGTLTVPMSSFEPGQMLVTELKR